MITCLTFLPHDLFNRLQLLIVGLFLLKLKPYYCKKKKQIIKNINFIYLFLK